MKTLVDLAKVAALLSSPLLLGLYVYDRSGGNLFAPWLAPSASSETAPFSSIESSPDVSAGSVGDMTFEQMSRHFRERRQPLDVSAPLTTALPIPLVITSKSAAVDLVTVPQAAAPAPNAPGSRQAAPAQEAVQR